MANGQYFSALVRLYHASFDRSSDSAGVANWATQLASGSLSIADVADEFIQSDEFISLYGDNVSDEEFVNLLYTNVLKREADEDGFNGWLNQLENGTSRSDVLIGFSDSDEHVQSTEIEYADELDEAERIEIELNGTDDSDDLDDSDESTHQDHSDEDALSLLYDAAFNRTADEEGLGHWISQLARSDISLEDVANYFIESAEFQNIYGENVSNDDFIEALYENTLDRASDASGKANWLGQLASGMARSELLTAFSESQEHANIVLTGTAIETPEISIA
ncbi:DUF4214 domain-containing protein [Sulfurimonas sp.]|jgi:hypothetical protein|uniref:DUF4214 domain-containing protein n=1 Tax=Sulfurimonas sp. TaxID=2022749 RepID=UPI00286DCA58|nr:DUF4214 domain-containing protein [Sulfurimonas sp.]